MSFVAPIGAGFLLEGSIPRFWAIALAQVLWGAGYTFTSGATQAWISDEIGEARAGQAFLRGSQAGQTGSLVGLLASMVLVNVSVNLPILVGGGMFLLLGLFLLIAMPEEWASDFGYRQIRAWSSQDKQEAIPMWNALDYCMCPAKIWVEWCKEVVDGYYVAKRLTHGKPAENLAGG